jgi:glyoxalase family protein
MRLEGIHHISAITGDARANVDFYTRVLGLRLVAKSVNQDNPGVYHLFFGSERGEPGADLTFFEYPGAIPGRPGAGMIHRIVWRVGSKAALGFWIARLASNKIAFETEDDSIRFADPEGLDHELLVANVTDPPLTAFHPEIPADMALQGFEGVRAYSFNVDSSARLLERLMGARLRDDGSWQMRGAQRGGWIAFDPAPAERGRQSGGSVHHVAWGTNDAEMPAWMDRVNGAGVGNSGLIDRHYFHSLYFREPGGILYELATEEPGFTVDAPVEEFGRQIILPPFLEHQRGEIEANLTPLEDPRMAWPASAR